MKNIAGRKLHMTWRYSQGGFLEAAEKEYSSGCARYYYGENLVNSPVATEFVEIYFQDCEELSGAEQAEALLHFIKAVSTQQWNDGYRDAIHEMQAFLKDDEQH